MSRPKPGKNPAPAATEPKPKEKRIKVRALETGYYDHARRREGDVFIADEKDFSKRWMERVSTGTPERVSTAQESIDKQNAELKASRLGTAGDDTEL